MQECKEINVFDKKIFTFLVQPSVDQADLEWSQKTQLKKKKKKKTDGNFDWRQMNMLYKGRQRHKSHNIRTSFWATGMLTSPKCKDGMTLLNTCENYYAESSYFYSITSTMNEFIQSRSEILQLW